MLSRAFDHICMKEARYKFLIITIIQLLLLELIPFGRREPVKFKYYLWLGRTVTWFFLILNKVLLRLPNEGFSKLKSSINLLRKDDCKISKFEM